MKAVSKLRRDIYKSTEVKFDQVSTVAGTPTPIPNTGYVSSQIINVAQGDGNQERTGNKIKVIAWRFVYSIAVDRTASWSKVRVLLLRDKQQHADTAPTIDTVLSTSSDYPISPRNQGEDARARYHIYYDKMHVLNNLDKATVSGMHYCKPKIVVSYNGSQSGDFQSNGLFMIAVSDQGTYVPVMSWNSTAWYVDP